MRYRRGYNGILKSVSNKLACHLSDLSKLAKCLSSVCVSVYMRVTMFVCYFNRYRNMNRVV